MPYLRVTVSAEQSQDMTSKVVSFLTEHTAALLGKKVEVISIAIDYLSPTHWAIGGKTLAEQNKASFYLEIKITDGTNLKQEKAEYIQKVYAEFESMLGPIHPASYIVLHDVGADAWGFGGVTQEFRYIQGKHPGQSAYKPAIVNG